jgi:hypothetical protein
LYFAKFLKNNFVTTQRGAEEMEGAANVSNSRYPVKKNIDAHLEWFA